MAFPSFHACCPPAYPQQNVSVAHHQTPNLLLTAPSPGLGNCSHARQHSAREVFHRHPVDHFFRSCFRQGSKTRSPDIRCQGWFEFNSDLSIGSDSPVKTGDFKILSHLKDLGCGEVKSKPKAIHFRGCINESYSFDCAGGKFFVKINRLLGAKDIFAGEYEALQKLNMSKAIRVPHPLGFGDLPDGGSYIILEHLQFRPFALGDQAVELQSKEEGLLNRVTDVLDCHDCKPSILHGDLWMGNTGLISTGEVAVFDPATFIGDAEFDLAFQGWAPVQDFPDGAEYYKHVVDMVDTLL